MRSGKFAPKNYPKTLIRYLLEVTKGDQSIEWLYRVVNIIYIYRPTSFGFMVNKKWPSNTNCKVSKNERNYVINLQACDKQIKVWSIITTVANVIQHNKHIIKAK